MFVQFIEGRVDDAEALRRQTKAWHDDLAAGADGWLGTTAGITDDGVGFMAARFESEEAARSNSDRPEQGQWWAATEAAFDGEVSFVDCNDVEEFRESGSDDAGFVQVIRGRVRDLDEMRAAMDDGVEGDDFRPDVIGGYMGAQPDGSYTQVVYFTSEEEARAGERAESETAGDDMASTLAPMHLEGPTFLDLRDPWLFSP